MKTSLLFASLAALGGLPLHAQETPTALSAPAVDAHDGHGAAAADAGGRFSFEIPGETRFADAVQQLRGAAKENGATLPNLIIDPAAKVSLVAELRLSSVSAADALVLLAAAANCQTEPIMGTTGGLIGLRITAPSLPPAAMGSMGMASGLGGGHLSGGGAGTGLPAGLGGAGGGSGGGLSAGAEPGEERGEQFGFVVTGVSGADAGGGAPAVAVSHAPSADVVATVPEQTRVFPLGGILAGLEGVEREAKMRTLQAVLVEIARPAKPDLSFHSSTEILVCKGPPDVQELMQQTLAAMRENARDRAGLSAGPLPRLENELSGARRRIVQLEAELEKVRQPAAGGR